MAKTVKEIAHFLQGEISGDGKIAISGVNGLDEAREGDISFVLNPKHMGRVDTSNASCIIVPKSIAGSFAKTVIKVENPSIAFSKIIEFLMPDRLTHPKGVHKTAIVSPHASVGRNVALGAYVVIEDGVTVGDNSIIYPFCYIGKNTKIGCDCLIYPNVTIREELTVGNRVIIHAGTVLGSDGFGYDTKPDGTHVKIPQLGIVVIEDDVEIGACVTIDRARFSKTVIGKGSKIDNLVQVAHNVIIGPHSILAAQTGISGSTVLGRNVVLGGKVGVADHVKLGDFVMAGGGSSISKSFPAKTVLFGYPARQVDKMREMLACQGLLPRLYERVRKLEKKIEELEKK